MSPAKAARRGGVGKRARVVDPASLNTEPYTFEHDGQEHQLPSFSTLKSGLIRRIRNLDEADAFYTVLETVADKDTLAAVDDMTMVELSTVMKGWQEHAQVSLGESRRSSS